MVGRYGTHDAFRTALEQRLRDQARRSGRPLDRLRKEVAHQRLLARLAAVAPSGAWTLKGGLALLARLDERARATSDADTNWRGDLEDLERTLDRVAALDLGDGFSFEIGRPRSLAAETEEGGLRFPVTAVLAGREFERMNLDVNVVPGDRRPTEEIRLRDLLAFADLPAPSVPVVPIGQQLAEKLHAYVRRYGNGSGRPRDLYDMLVIAERLPVPPAAQLVQDCRETFRIRESDWPPQMEDPPAEWAEAWGKFVAVYAIPWSTLPEAAKALRGFWHPITGRPIEATWNPDRWRWDPTG